MNKISKALSLAYFLIGIIFIIVQDQTSFYSGLVLKGIIIPILMVLLLVNRKSVPVRLLYIILAALIFSWAGDVILEFSQRSETFFIPGLVSFLLAHLMYLTAFLKTPGRNSILKNRIYLLFPVLVYGGGLITFLYPDLGSMRLPVTIYALVIFTMLGTAINRLEKVNPISFYLVLSGAILFVLSDSAIAVNKFGHHFGSSGIVIMSTYILAQYLIITGYIKQFDRYQE
jgi:uncharacterized membrane protein YhhN